MCDWSSDVCSSDLSFPQELSITAGGLDRWSRPLPKSGIAETPNALARMVRVPTVYCDVKAMTVYQNCGGVRWVGWGQAALRQSTRSEEHTSELQSLMRNSYAVFCLKKKIINVNTLNMQS